MSRSVDLLDRFTVFITRGDDGKIRIWEVQSTGDVRKVETA